MDLLPAGLRARLPPLSAIEDEDNPMVWFRFFLEGTRLSWFAVAGEPEGDDFLFFGFVSGPNEFRRFLLSELDAKRGLFEETVVRDESFAAGLLTDVVPAPDR